jgi:hypothetical protein
MTEQNEKQAIEEMARALCRDREGGNNRIDKCSDCVCYGICIFIQEATRAYRADYRKIPENIGEFSDGYHTFNELYHHRAVLFCKICELFPELAWKSKKHDTGDMYDGMFIVGIETEYGQATYHFYIDPYWDMFGVKELEKAPKWDGHTPDDAIERIDNMRFKGYIKQIEGEWIWKSNGYKNRLHCSICNRPNEADISTDFCPNCGAKMKGAE